MPTAEMRTHQPYPRRTNYLLWLLLCSLVGCISGCNLFPDVRHQQRYHNPFPQLHTVAVLPFRNQSQESTLSGNRVSLAYATELQAIPGFQVLPTGVVETQLYAYEQTQLGRPLSTPEDFQNFANYLGVDAVLQGAITDYEAYYPPRMTLAVNWYTANPNYHPIPAGYGLPWGSKEEKNIPEWVRLEAERELASEQLKTQVPVEPQEAYLGHPTDTIATPNQSVSHATSTVGTSVKSTAVIRADYSAAIDQKDVSLLIGAADVEEVPAAPNTAVPNEVNLDMADTYNSEVYLEDYATNQMLEPTLQWPDPQGFIPPAPSLQAPLAKKSISPIISHVHSYNGSDEDFTSELEDYFYFRDDERFGGWEAYLQRSEDFIRFCCHLHIKQTLVSRGGALKNRTVVRWPLSRYER